MNDVIEKEGGREGGRDEEREVESGEGGMEGEKNVQVNNKQREW